MGVKKPEVFWSVVSVLTGGLDGGERVERAGASLGGAPASQRWRKGGQMLLMQPENRVKTAVVSSPASSRAVASSTRWGVGLGSNKLTRWKTVEDSGRQ